MGGSFLDLPLAGKGGGWDGCSFRDWDRDVPSGSCFTSSNWGKHVCINRAYIIIYITQFYNGGAGVTKMI